MALLENLALVLLAGIVTDLATGIGALPFFLNRDFSDSMLVFLWGLAFGIMFFASVFGLIPEGLASGTIFEVALGLSMGVLLVVLASRYLDHRELDPGVFEEAEFREMVLILGVLTVHSFPEGVSIGVSFAEIGLEGGVPVLGFAVPSIAVMMTIAISIQNIPEGVAISIPFKSMGMSKWRMLGAAVFSSLPQPIGAVIAFVFVRQAQQLMPVGFGFAAGAMIYLVFTEFIQDARKQGESLEEWRGKFGTGIAAGLLIMAALFYFL